MSIWTEPRVNNGIDLRKELHELMHGDNIKSGVYRWVIHRKALIGTRTTGWDEYNSELINKYKQSTKRGWRYEDRLVRAYMILNEKLKTEEQPAVPGIITVPKKHFYFEYYVRPRLEDEILEIYLQDDGKPVSPIEIKHRHLINYVHDYREEDGRLIYWEVIAEAEEF